MKNKKRKEIRRLKWRKIIKKERQQKNRKVEGRYKARWRNEERMREEKRIGGQNR